jgi:DNA-binding HxlR family transcriptional regulator
MEFSSRWSVRRSHSTAAAGFASSGFESAARQAHEDRAKEAQVMTSDGYGQFCPVSMAAEIVCSRWTLLVLRELCLGASRFNELRRGVPRMSPALLSSRLKALEAAGVVQRLAGEGGAAEYRLTQAGAELRPVIEAIGVWGQKWVTTEATLKHIDGDLLMWDIRRNIDTRPLPRRRTNIQFSFPDWPRAQKDYWLVVEPDGEIDLCKVDPGFEVDLYVSTDLRTLAEIWLGYLKIGRARDEGRLALTGERAIEASLEAWLKLSLFAKVPKEVA